jgi:hypothetical protein
VRQSVSRRSFLLASAGLVAGVTAACKSSGDDEINVSPSDTTDNKTDLNLVVASYVHMAGIDERVALAFLGSTPPSGPVRFSIDREPVTATLHNDGIDLPYFLVRHTFDKPGVHEVQAVVNAKVMTTPIQVTDPATAKIPFAGKAMIRVPTSTTADARGVNPICTSQPACPLHDVSLDAALAEKRPIALLFATPALCQSRLCGPVLQNLLALRDEFGSKVRMVHAEIYTDMSGKTTTPAVQAYGLTAEPFLFLAGADGIVRDRLDNAYDKAEVRDALTRLVA